MCVNCRYMCTEYLNITCDHVYDMWVHVYNMWDSMCVTCVCGHVWVPYATIQNNFTQ